MAHYTSETATRYATETETEYATETTHGDKTAHRLQEFLTTTFKEFPWQGEISDWTGNAYTVGTGKAKHWYGEPIRVNFHTKQAARDLVRGNALRALERFLEGEIDIEGNLFLFPYIEDHAKLQLKPWQKLAAFIAHNAFQNISRARVNVKSHYDISQECLNHYLDKVYMSYSCGMWEDPWHLDRKELVKVGKGKEDGFDSLEKAQWRKFKDAVDFINPKKGETLLDIGVGHGGQLAVALENYPFG